MRLGHYGTPIPPSPPCMAHGSGVIVQLAEPDPATMTSSVVPWAVSDCGGGATRANPSCKGPGAATERLRKRLEESHESLHIYIYIFI